MNGYLHHSLFGWKSAISLVKPNGLYSANLAMSEQKVFDEISFWNCASYSQNYEIVLPRTRDAEKVKRCLH